MVKFGKEYRSLQLEEWKKYYFNYKALKQKIKEMKQALLKNLTIKEEPRPELLSIPLIPDDLNDTQKEKGKGKETLSSLYNDEKGKYLKEFIELFLSEFKKSYSFFAGIEKVLINKINTHLYTQTSYSTYNLSELSKEMKSISLTVYFAKSLNAFINDVMMAIKKILKKFDKNFSRFFGNITPHLILQMLSKKNSELEYILQFKIIDEITTISQSNIKELKNYFDQNNDNSNEDAQYREEFMKKYDETFKYIDDIDELTFFKAQYQDWIDYSSGRNTLRKGFKYFENDIFNPILSASYNKDNLLDKFLSTKEAFSAAKKIQSEITPENKRNIILLMVQTFFYNSLLTCIFPIIYYYEYVRSLGDEDSILNDLWFVNLLLFAIVSITYISQFLSIFFFYNYTSRKNIKLSYLLSYIFTFIGSLLYISSIYSGQGHFKIRAIFLGISRILIGLGSNPMVGKKYITIYSPRYYLPLISKIYLIIELLGFILGPIIAALLMYINYKEIICLFNSIGYYGAFGSFILFIIHLVAFVSPQSENFSIVKNTIKGDINKSNSQTNPSFFENIEDDEDKEYYKLQRDKKNKKNDKSALDATKSDEIHIEVNDNDASKVAISKTVKTNDSKLNEEKEKEEEEENDNYKKIMEEAGNDIMGQNEIAENYDNNVDTGRFSYLDISKEQRDTIKELEIKLYQYQEKSNFTYIDMIPRTLDDIILKEQKTFGYMNRNLLLMLILLLFNNLIKENLIVHSSYFMLFKVYNNGTIISSAKEIEENTMNKNEAYISNGINYNYFFEINNFNNNNTNIEKLKELEGKILDYSKNNKFDIQLICYFTSAEFILQLASLFFIMPFYKINIIFKKNLIIFMIISIILMIPLSFNLFYDHIYLFVPIVSIDIFIHKIIEIMCSCYLVYLIPPKWQYSHIRASSLPIYLMIFGKFAGCLICSIGYTIENIEYNQHLLSVIAFLIYGIIGLIIYKSKNFKISTLSRILRKKALE